jgi:hypothetical protein
VPLDPGSAPPPPSSDAGPLPSSPGLVDDASPPSTASESPVNAGSPGNGGVVPCPDVAHAAQAAAAHKRRPRAPLRTVRRGIMLRTGCNYPIARL